MKTLKKSSLTKAQLEELKAERERRRAVKKQPKQKKHVPYQPPVMYEPYVVPEDDISKKDWSFS